MKTIVVSAVNIRQGGTLTILRNCLQYLSAELVSSHNYRVVALVHDKKLCSYPNIEYIEFPWTTKSWINRLWCEYVTLQGISKKLSPVYLWLSLHDTTPNVKAERRAVYCQTSFPFMDWKFGDFKYNYKIPLFAIFTKYIYRTNIHKNNFLIVQQNWLREGFSKMFSVDKQKIIVAPPAKENTNIIPQKLSENCTHFLYAAIADNHKNFEVLCKAAELLENEIGKNKFKVTLTLKGDENKYARMLYEKWKSVNSIHFAGYMSKDELFSNYEQTDCLIFPSRIETWGLPISEFMAYNKPMLLADLPYAHETPMGSNYTAFFHPYSAEELKNKMKALVIGDYRDLKPIKKASLEFPFANNWKELFQILLEK